MASIWSALRLRFVDVQCGVRRYDISVKMFVSRLAAMVANGGASGLGDGCPGRMEWHPAHIFADNDAPIALSARAWPIVAMAIAVVMAGSFSMRVSSVSV